MFEVLRAPAIAPRRRAPQVFVWMYRLFPSVLNAITVVKPETVIRWHRRGFRAYWRWKSRRRDGRPRINRDSFLSSDLSMALCGPCYRELMKIARGQFV